MTQESYEYFINEVFDKKTDTYEECFEEGIEYGLNHVKGTYVKNLGIEIKKRIPLHEWYKIKDLFE